jgi:hypothetical protein
MSNGPPLRGRYHLRLDEARALRELRHAASASSAATTCAAAPASCAVAASCAAGSDAATLTARLVGAVVLRRSGSRVLRVTIRVPASARARVQLLQQGFERLQRIVALTTGMNAREVVLQRLKNGSYRLRITIRGTGAAQAALTRTLGVPAAR